MSDEISEPLPVKWTTDEQVQIELNAYLMAVGKVAHSWNYLHEHLGRLFCRILRPDSNAIGAFELNQVAAAVWYAPNHDRTQRELLFAAITVSTEPVWQTLPRNAKDELLSVIQEINALGKKRDAAIHAPAFFMNDDKRREMVTRFGGHKRASDLYGKRLLTEFDYYSQLADSISRYIISVFNAMTFGGYTWPDKPRKPNHRPRNSLLGQVVSSQEKRARQGGGGRTGEANRAAHPRAR